MSYDPSWLTRKTPVTRYHKALKLAAQCGRCHSFEMAGGLVPVDGYTGLCKWCREVVEPDAAHGIWDYAPIFGLFSCRCGRKFETGAALDEHLEAL